MDIKDIKSKRITKIVTTNGRTLRLSLTSELLDMGCEVNDDMEVVHTKNNEIIITKIK